MRNVTYYWSPGSYWWWTLGDIQTTDDACYSKAGPFFSPDADWQNWFFHGGPGDEAPGCD